MYGKLFASLYQGTLRGRANEILVFTNLIAHAGPDGIVDKHWRAIAEEVGLPVEDVKKAIEALEAPDPESRTPDCGGARLVRLDQHRAWGWQIVNHGKYRSIRNAEDRREQNRQAQAVWRERNQPSASVSQRKPQSAHTEAEVDSEAEAKAETETKAESTTETKPAGAGRGVRGQKFDPSTLTIPMLLDTPEFREHWAKWVTYRMGGKKSGDWRTLFEAQLEKLEREYPQRAVEVIRHSIASGYQGLFPPKPRYVNGMEVKVIAGLDETYYGSISQKRNRAMGLSDEEVGRQNLERERQIAEQQKQFTGV